MDAHADPNFRRAHSYFVCFVVLRLIYILAMKNKDFKSSLSTFVEIKQLT